MWVLIFSGHYCVYGVNIQAKCDADCRFLIVSLTAPGKTNESFAGHLSKLVLKHCLLSILLQWIVLTAFQNMQSLLILVHNVTLNDCEFTIGFPLDK